MVLISVIISSSALTASAQSGGTFAEFLDDYDETTGLFASHDPGESVEVIDTVRYVLYDDEGKVTHIWLESEGVGTKKDRLILPGDHSEEFKEKDEIRIEFFIISEIGAEGYDYGIDDITHIVRAEREEPKSGIDLFGTNYDILPDQLDNDSGRFLIKLLIWLMIGAFTVIILDPIVKKVVERSQTKIDDIILSIIRKPVLILIVLYGLVDALQELALPDMVMDIFFTIYGVGFIAMVTWICLKIFQGVLIELGRSWAKKSGSKLEHVLVPVLDKIGTILISVFGMFYILGYLGINIIIFGTSMGLMGLVIAFAAQDTLSNFFGGIFLIIEPNFKEEDIIIVDGNYYKVQKIGMRTTRLYDIFKHIIVVVPNDTLANEKLINITEPDHKIKEKLSVGVAYGVDTYKVEGLLLEIFNAHPDVLNDPKRKAVIRFEEFGDSSLNFMVYFWVNDLDNRYRVKHELRHTIHKKFAEAGIEIPFPQRVVTLIDESKNN
jgi:small-conductance mechanosensitive channel